MKRLVLCVLALSAALMVVAPPALADDTTCGGGAVVFPPAFPPVSPALGPVTVDNVVVPSGSVCTMVGTQVRGSVRVDPGATVQIWLADIRGNVNSFSPFFVDLYSTHVGGSYLNTGGAADNDICGSRIDGNLQLERTRGNDRIGVGSIVTFCAPNFANTIGGNLIAEKVAGTTATIRGNTVGGTLQVQKGRNNVITNNTVRQNLQYFDNAFGQIIGNTIGEDLQCQNNSPAPVGAGNTARQKQGQCATF